MPAAPEPKDAGVFSELVRATRGLLLIARRRPLAILAAIAAVALVPSCACCVGFAIVPLLAATALGIAREAATGEKVDVGAGTLAVTFGQAVVPLVAFVALSAATPFFATPLPRVAAMAIATAVAGALAGLLAGTTFHVLGGRRIADSVELSLGDALRAGLGSRAAAGAFIALLTTALPAALAEAPPAAAGAATWVAALVGSVFAQGIGLVWMLALGLPTVSAVTARSPRGVVTRLLWLVAPVATIGVAAIGFAAARPSPAHSEPTAAERETSAVVGDSIALPGEHGLVVRHHGHGVLIEAADGGGLGEIDLGEWATTPTGADGVRYSRSESGDWIVYARDYRTGFPAPIPASVLRGVRFDARGVRTDDGLLHRIRWRFGEVGLLLLLVSLLLAAPFLVVLARGIGSAATLDRGEAGGDYAAWSGALELDAESEPRVVGGRLTAVDGARLVRDGSDGVVTLAPGALVLGPDGPLASGARVSVVARSSRLATLGPRTGSVAWPKDAWLVVGSLDAAKDRIVRTSLRTAAVFGVPSALAALCACVASLLSS